ncbi:MAG: hypothetical protein ACI4V7_01540 [Succinivibrionaceae bacterium]
MSFDGLDKRRRIQQQLFDIMVSLCTKKIDNEQISNIDNLKRQFEELTGKPIKTFEEVQKSYIDNLEEDIKKIREDFKQKRLAYLLENCDVNPYWEFENMQDNGCEDYREKIEYCKKWVDSICIMFEQCTDSYVNSQYEKSNTPGSLLWIFGDFGVGKSMLAGSIAHRYIRKHYKDALLIQFRTMWKKMISLGSFGGELAKYEDYLIDIDLLVLDEIAVDNKKLSDAQQQTLGQLLRSRKNKGKNTIIVSNSEPKSLYALVGNFCYESIRNYQPIVPIKLFGKNWRPTEACGFDLIPDFAKNISINNVNESNK